MTSSEFWVNVYKSQSSLMARKHHKTIIFYYTISYLTVVCFSTRLVSSIWVSWLIMILLGKSKSSLFAERAWLHYLSLEECVHIFLLRFLFLFIMHCANIIMLFGIFIQNFCQTAFREYSYVGLIYISTTAYMCFIKYIDVCCIRSLIISVQSPWQIKSLTMYMEEKVNIQIYPKMEFGRNLFSFRIVINFHCLSTRSILYLLFVMPVKTIIIF